MPIDPKTEKAFRDLLDHALHNRLDDVARGIAEAGPETYEHAAALAVQVAAYIVINAAERYPSAADLKKTASIAAESKTNLPIAEDDIHAFLSRMVFGTENGLAVFQGNEDAPLIPLYATANLILSFTPKGTKMWNYLDVIESAIEAAEQARADTLPAFVYRFSRK